MFTAFVAMVLSGGVSYQLTLAAIAHNAPLVEIAIRALIIFAVSFILFFIGISSIGL